MDAIGFAFFPLWGFFFVLIAALYRNPVVGRLLPERAIRYLDWLPIAGGFVGALAAMSYLTCLAYESPRPQSCQDIWGLW
jgi:hypothetical protein